MIETGIKRFDWELETENMMKTIMMMRIGFKTLFTKSERFLIRNNKRFVITSDESDTASRDGKKTKENASN